MKTSFSIRKLCTPAFIYLALSVFGLLALIFENMGSDEKQLCIGTHRCDISNKGGMLVLNVLYILFWTFILDLLCKNGYTNISWFILLLPIFLYMITLVLLVLYIKV